MDELEDGAPQHLLRPVTQHPLAGGADVVEDAGHVCLPHHVQHVVGDAAQPELGFPQGLLGPAMHAPHLGLLQLSLHYGAQPGQVALHQVVLGAHPHRLHRGGLADGAGDYDEGQVDVHLPN